MEFTTLLAITLVTGYLVKRFFDHFHFWKRQGLGGRTFITLEWIKVPMHEFIWENAKIYGKVYGAYNLVEKILVVNDAKMARELSIKELHKFPLRSSFYMGNTNFVKSLFLMAANEDWKRVRSIVTPAFTSGKLKAMLTPIERIVSNFVEHLEKHSLDGQVFDIKQYTSGFTMDVIASCAYGINVDSVSQPNHPIVENAKKILSVDANFSYIMCMTFPGLSRFLKLEAFNVEAIKYFDNLTFEIIEKRLKNAEKLNPDLIGLMMENEDGVNDGTNESSSKLKGISRDEISGQGILFFIAGFDTSNATFCHLIYYLTKHPEWQEKLHEELSALKEEITYDTLRDLKILNAVINETLRLNPPLVIIQRAAIQDCTLLDTGIRVPKNTIISISPYCIHRNPEYFPAPLQFKPERFLEPGADSNPAFMPFGVGHRLCVGMRFAQNELRIGLANLVLKYRIVPNPDLKLDYFKGSILMSPKDVMVQIELR